MRLRHEVTARQAVEILRDLARLVKNEASNLAATTEGQTNRGVRHARDSYLVWADGAERRLRELFSDSDIIGLLHSDRYWRIHALDRYSARPMAVIGAEIEAQQALLTEAADRFDEYTRLSHQPGKALVLDTNVFLHYQLITDIDWRKGFQVDAARLFIPAQVLHELDEKTFSGKRRLAKRADKVLRVLAKFMDGLAGDSVVEIKSGVTLELLSDYSDHRSRTNVDAEILDRAQFLQQVIERPVTLVTSDINMGVGARLRGLQTQTPGEEFRLRDDE